MNYWAKTTDGKPSSTVEEHGIATGNIARQLVAREGLDPAITTLAAVHDVGKISTGFQSKCQQWLIDNCLTETSEAEMWTYHVQDHARVSQYSVQKLCSWAAAVGAHHGRIQAPVTPDIGMQDDTWEAVRQVYINTMVEHFGPLPQGDPKQPDLWHAAGLITVADWIASGEHTLQEIGMFKPCIEPDLNFTDIFPFTPNELQQQTAKIIATPGLYLIESPMGSGKTEASLWAAYRLLKMGFHDGLFVAMPTQTTSNMLYGRVEDFVNRIASDSTRLVHANAWLEHTERDWFSPSKRSLLASFGVGTVDQALMAVMAVKHFFVRRYALANKVVIFDEIHSYDIYTGTLIKVLCRELFQLGCTVIMMSATLSDDARSDLIGESGTHIYHVPNRNYLYKVKPDTPFIVALSEAQKAATAGAKVLWVCNTVNAAQNTYRQLLTSNLDVGLLHARFPVYRRKQLEEKWLPRFGKQRPEKSGCILVSTQIVEQSLDIDADLLITELAPTDLLLQRTGRLWRHYRANRPFNEPLIYILEFPNLPDDISLKEAREEIGSSSYVYEPYVLARTAGVWRSIEEILIPSDINILMADTYNQRDCYPELLEAMVATRRRHEQLAVNETNIFQPQADDVEFTASTRLQSQPTKVVALLSDDNTFIDGTLIDTDRRRIHLNSLSLPLRVCQGGVVVAGRDVEYSEELGVSWLA